MRFGFIWYVNCVCIALSILDYVWVCFQTWFGNLTVKFCRFFWVYDKVSKPHTPSISTSQEVDTWLQSFGTFEVNTIQKFRHVLEQCPKYRYNSKCISKSYSCIGTWTFGAKLYEILTHSLVLVPYLFFYFGPRMSFQIHFCWVFLTLIIDACHPCNHGL